uniref:Uncharacterized protein n=1 Tax=Piliocolobus tephrosceles TaxID=591936 RepID=A0A8C9HIT7_9PRIM
EFVMGHIQNRHGQRVGQASLRSCPDLARERHSHSPKPGMLPSPLSREQLLHIQTIKAAALLRLAAHSMPVVFGESWKKHLNGEFGKLYSIKRMGFVAAERKHYTVYPPQHQVFTWTQMCDIGGFGKHL